MSEKSAGWKIESEYIYETFKIFRLRKSVRINPRTQSPVEFFLMDGVDWVNIIALTSEQQVVLVKQYRHGSEEDTLEIPGGCAEHGEDPQDSALRELLEETGYSAKQISKLGVLHPNPAMQAMRCHCYLALDAYKVAEPTLDAGEDIKVSVEPLADVLEKVRTGEITHSLVVSAFALYLLANPKSAGYSRLRPRKE